LFKGRRREADGDVDFKQMARPARRALKRVVRCCCSDELLDDDNADDLE
jgi:hypothetical protein